MHEPNHKGIAEKLRSFFILSIIVSIGVALAVLIPGHLDLDLLRNLVTFDSILAGVAAVLACVMVAELRRGLQLLGSSLPPSLFDEVIDRVTKLPDNHAKKHHLVSKILGNS